MSDYASRLAKQVDQYRHVENIHDLPEIFHYWSNKFIRPAIEQLFGAESIPGFFGAALMSAAHKGGAAAPSFVSIGAGDCSIEMAIAEWLVAHGMADFSIDCLELSPHLLERAAAAAKAKRLDQHLRLIESDLNHAAFPRRYDGAMAHHSLHHIVALEHVFEQVRSRLEPHGVFAISDMVGRNGHMRWPEALDVVQALWRMLPEAKRYNHQTKRVEEQYVNHDCSGEGFEGMHALDILGRVRQLFRPQKMSKVVGAFRRLLPEARGVAYQLKRMEERPISQDYSGREFEGIRAQDILPLLLQSFQPRIFLGFGGLPDVFVSRAFGHNFSSSEPWDRDFIDLVQMLNDRMIDGGTIKPTMMLALFDLDSPACAYHRTWSPAFCVRPAA